MTRVDPPTSQPGAFAERAGASSGAIRLIAVGGAAFAGAVREAIEPCRARASVTAVDDYLAALGELSQRPAAAVISPAAAIAGIEQAAARALRQLAPAVRLVVVTPGSGDDALSRYEPLGFDACLTEPLTAADLAAALDLPGPAAGARSDTTAAAKAPAGTDPPHQPHQANQSPAAAKLTNGAAPHASPEADATDAAPAASERPPMDDPAAAEVAPIDAVAEAGQLGDVDLIDVILTEAGGLQERAMQLLRAQSALTAPGWVDRADQVPAGHAAAAITGGGQVFGVLHAEPPADQLGPWAGWLGRWLAMDQRLRSFHQLAMRDELTGVWNRRYFHRFLERVLPSAQRERSQVTLLVFDIDDFKLYNDHFGHPAGDEILISVGQLMQSLVREHDVVARIGGDEFAVIFWEAEGPRHAHSRHPQDVLEVARRFQKAVCEHRFPKLLEEAGSTLTISGGLASFPWDGRTVDELLAHADNNALTSKRQGKNVITFGPGACQVQQSQDKASDESA
jgi:diguanylate cyclase (GGDEF)-like protein